MMLIIKMVVELQKVKKTFECINGHDIEIDLPNKFFSKGGLIFPCPNCEKKYLIDKNGNVELCEQGPIVRSFLAMHY